MKEYHKIQTLFKRNPADLSKVIPGEYALPVFEALEKCQWEFTEKIDGTNIRVCFDGVKVWFGGKTDNAQIFSGLYGVLQDHFTLEKMKQCFPEAGLVCLYGEGYGAKIQKGGGNYIKDGQDFILFDVKVGDWWLQRDDVNDVASKLGVRSVPIVGHGTLPDMVDFVRNGMASTFGSFEAEGLVARPVAELFTRRGERVITKLKVKDFK